MPAKICWSSASIFARRESRSSRTESSPSSTSSGAASALSRAPSATSYLGKVTRVLPGLQAAFIDIGQERAAFLHVEDLIRPGDFDTYLQGTRKEARDEDAPEVTGNEELDTEAEAEIEDPPPVHEALTETDVRP